MTENRYISTRSLSDISEEETFRLSVDLVSAARRNIEFFRGVAQAQWLHESPAVIVEAIRRYEELWMPLISHLTVQSKTPPLVLPPLDIQWVWFCHSLNPVKYRIYCESRFSKLIGKPAIFDEENEDYASMRCREIWESRYPSECFENEIDSDLEKAVDIPINEDILFEVRKHRDLYKKFLVSYMKETVYLIAAKQRYRGFLFLLQKVTDGCSRLVPTLDILLMWVTHQSYPTIYAEDLKDMEGDIENMVSVGGIVNKEEVEETKKLWDRAFDQPYEKAGAELPLMDFDGVASANPLVHWEVSDADVNTKYKSLTPRFLLEVCLFMRLSSRVKEMPEDIKRNFLCLQMVRCHKELRMENCISDFSLDSWQKAWHLYCEFGTRGLTLQLHHRGGGFFKRCKLLDMATLLWNDLLRAPSLALAREVGGQVRVVASITPPVQGPYLLKCVPDRVTDDSGAMVSDVILRMNRYRPQEGRWLSRTVLDHAGRECFVVRIRVGGGFWRRGGETPSAVKWEDRIIEIREGSWSYVADSIGRTPAKVVGTATPKEPPGKWQAAWNFSTGDELLISWESSTSVSGLRLTLINETSPDSYVKLLIGRKMQYQMGKTTKKMNSSPAEESGELEDDQEGFVTFVRFDEDNPNGRATALLNWKLLAVELLPEEDTVLILLLCISILRSVSEMRKQDMGSLLVRRRLKEAKLGARDWGSVIIHPSSLSPSPSYCSPYLQPWHWNPEAVMASEGADLITGQPRFGYSPVEGGDNLYKRVMLT